MEWLYSAQRDGYPDESKVRAQIEGGSSNRNAPPPSARNIMAGFQPHTRRRLLPMPIKLPAELRAGDRLQNTLAAPANFSGERRTPDNFDLEFRKYAHLRWSIKYDPDNMQEVLAVSDEETSAYC